MDFQAPTPDTESLAVDGTFTNLPGPHVLRLSRIGNYSTQVFPRISGAEVALYDEAGNRYDYVETLEPNGQATRYELDLQGTPGVAYSLQIRLPSGVVYRTAPQVLPAPVALDSLVVEPELQQLVTPAGITIEDPIATVYAYSKAPATAGDHFLRWDGDGVFIFNEIVKTYNPFGIQKQCFIKNRISDQRVATADLRDYQPGAVLRKAAGRRRIDFAFEHRFCFVVFQRTISREAYDYWRRIGDLLAASGTIFDPPPARVAGNVANVSDPQNPALGFFEVAGVDTKRVYARDSDFPPAFRLSSDYCLYDYTRWPPVNHPECDDCLQLPNSTLEKPAWWE